MPSYVKCRFCEEHIPMSMKDTLVKETKVSESGRRSNWYYHQECYPKELDKREFLRREREAKDRLNETVKKIYNLKFDLPARWWEIISDLREGTNRYQKFWKKRYKAGVPFDVIREAYLLSVQDIEWARMSKQFKTIEQELRYGLAIVQSKINDAYKKMKAREQQEKINQANEKMIAELQDDVEVEFKKTKRSDDYRHLLGDD